MSRVIVVINNNKVFNKGNIKTASAARNKQDIQAKVHQSDSDSVIHFVLIYSCFTECEFYSYKILKKC